MGDKQQLTVSARVQALANTAHTDAQRAWAEAAHQAGVLVVDRLGARARAEYARSSNTGVTGAVTATGTAVRVEGGYRVSGSWPRCWGLRQAGWIVVPAISEGRGNAVVVLVRARECAITAGDAGAGTVWMSGVVVPDHRCMAVQDLLDGAPMAGTDRDALSGQPIVPVLAALAAGPCVGIARAAVGTIDPSRVRVPVTHIRQTQQVLAALTEKHIRAITATLERVEALVRGVAAEVDRHVRTGHHWRRRDRVDCRARLEEVVRLTDHLCDLTAAVHGARTGDSAALAFLRGTRTGDRQRSHPGTTGGYIRTGHTLV